MQTCAYFSVLRVSLMTGETRGVRISLVAGTSPAIVQIRTRPLPDATTQSPLAFDFQIDS